jgi:hypothetical protein
MVKASINNMDCRKKGGAGKTYKKSCDQENPISTRVKLVYNVVMSHVVHTVIYDARLS